MSQTIPASLKLTKMFACPPQRPTSTTKSCSFRMRLLTIRRHLNLAKEMQTKQSKYGWTTKKSSTLENLTLFLAILEKQIPGSFNKYLLTFFLLWLATNLSFMRLNRPCGEDKGAAHHMYPLLTLAVQQLCHVALAVLVKPRPGHTKKVVNTSKTQPTGGNPWSHYLQLGIHSASGFV